MTEPRLTRENVDTLPRSRVVVPSNLPAQLTTFVGRQAELIELRTCLVTHRLVTLAGPGGCGKTRLALQVAEQLVEQYVDGVWFIELAAVSAPHLVPQTIARALGLREEPGRDLTETLCEQLADMSALVVLDNCEQVLDATGLLTISLLQAAPGIQLVVTSREPLGVPGEVTWRVPSLDDEAATQLFLERASLVRPEQAHEAAETEIITGICRRLDGIALAIELAAARTRMMTPADIAAALDDRFRLLTGGSRALLPRQQTLEMSVDWSHDLLDEQEQRLLRRLSVFSGGFTLEAAETVCADASLPSTQVLELLSHLVDKSLVQVNRAFREQRFALLDTLRLYAGERLDRSGESEQTRSQHLDHFVELAERVEPELVLADGATWVRRLEREHDNLRAALAWAEASSQHNSFLRLATALTLFWELSGHLAEGCRWFRRALSTAGGPSRLHARALWGAAHVSVYADDHETASRCAPEALQMAQDIGDDWAIARALTTLGWLQMWFDPAQARTTLAQAVSVGRSIGDNWSVADGLKMTTSAYLLQDDHDGVQGPLAELTALSVQLGNKFFAAWCHLCVGWVALRRGEFVAASHAMRACLDLCEEVGEPGTAGMATSLMGEIEMLTGNYATADVRFETYLQRANATGGGLGMPFAIRLSARSAIGRGKPELALTVLAASKAGGCVSFALPMFRAWALALEGSAHLAMANLEAAGRILGEAKDVAGQVGNPWLDAQVDYNLGQLARSQGDRSRAQDVHHEALAGRVRLGLRPGIIESLDVLAGLAVDSESHAEAVRLFAAAASLRQAIGLARWPADQDSHDAEHKRARDGLGEAAFDAAWAEGAALSCEQAVAYATRARGERKRPATGWDSLTPTELDVVRLTAAGLSNPEIGERLFIARGTVKTHLAHVFVKLGITSRAHLAAEAARRGA